MMYRVAWIVPMYVLTMGCAGEGESDSDAPPIQVEGAATASTDQMGSDPAREASKRLEAFAAAQDVRWNWEADLIPEGEFGWIHTLEYQDALESSESGDIAFVGSVTDVYRDGSTHYAEFIHHSVSGSDSFAPAVVFKLSCSEGQARQLLGDFRVLPEDRFSLFVLCSARIARVTRGPETNVNVSVMQDYNDMSADAETYSHIVAEGQCLVIEALEDWEPW